MSRGRPKLSEWGVRTVGVVLPLDMHQALERWADDNDMTKSEALRALLARRLGCA